MDDKKPGGSEWWKPISGLAGKILGKSDEPEPDPEEEPELTVEQKRAQALAPFRTLVAGRKGSAALALYFKTIQACEGWLLPEKDLLLFAELLLDDKLWNAAVPLLEDYLKPLPETSRPRAAATRPGARRTAAAAQLCGARAGRIAC